MGWSRGCGTTIVVVVVNSAAAVTVGTTSNLSAFSVDIVTVAIGTGHKGTKGSRMKSRRWWWWRVGRNIG